MNSRAQLRKRLAGITALALVFALAISSVAPAQDSSRRTYSGQSPFVASGSGSGGDGGGSADVASPGSLPFTGLDLGLAAGGAVLLIGAGAALASVARRSPETEHRS